MTVSLNTTSDCCDPVCETTVVNTPGPQGNAGAAGAAGAAGNDGSSGYSLTTASFITPAIGAAVNVFVPSTEIWAAGMYAYIEGSGFYYVNGKGASHVTVTRLGYPTDPGSTGVTVASGSAMVPTGPRGEAGASGTADFLTLKGQLLTRTALAQSVLNIGASDTMGLFTDSASSVGMKWRRPLFTDISDLLDLTNKTKNQLPLTSLGNVGGAIGDIAYWDGSKWVRLAAGAAEGKWLKISSGVPVYSDLPSSLGFAARADINVTVSGVTITGSTATNKTNIATSGALSGTVGGGGSAILTFETPLSSSDYVVIITPYTEVSSTFDAITVSSKTASSVGIHIDVAPIPVSFDFNIGIIL